MKATLTVGGLQGAAAEFAAIESGHDEPSLFGITDGKAVGTYLEHKFIHTLRDRFEFEESNSAKGIDFPRLGVDIKTTSIRQPQSSCPFKSARQKIFGLGYSLLVFVYEKVDKEGTRTSRLDVHHVIFVDAAQTADHQTTKGILEILDRDGNEDDLTAFMADRLLPVDDIEAAKIAEELLRSRPSLGYLTISNALQWRLPYKRVIDKAGSVDGVHRLYGKKNQTEDRVRRLPDAGRLGIEGGSPAATARAATGVDR